MRHDIIHRKLIDTWKSLKLEKAKYMKITNSKTAKMLKPRFLNNALCGKLLLSLFTVSPWLHLVIGLSVELGGRKEQDTIPDQKPPVHMRRSSMLACKRPVALRWSQNL